MLTAILGFIVLGFITRFVIELINAASRGY